MNQTETRVDWHLIAPDSVVIGNEELWEQWQCSNDSFLWINLQGAIDKNRVQWMREKFNLEPDHVKEALLERHPPNFEGNNKDLYLLLKMLDSDSHDLDFQTQQMAIFVGENYLITRHPKLSRYLDELSEKLLSGKINLQSPYQMAAMLTNRMVTRYGKVLLNLEQRLDVLEDELLSKPSEKILQELMSYNTALRKMRRILKYHLSVLEKLNRHTTRLALPGIEHQFENLAEEAERFNSLAELYQNVINDLIDGYISLNAHQLNQVMRVLTVVTVLFLPLGLLVGIYGMNFENMPELKNTYGYFILLGVMASIVTSLIYFFHKKRWL